MWRKIRILLEALRSLLARPPPPQPPPATPAPPTLPPQMPVGPCSTTPSKTQTLTLASATPPPSPLPTPPPPTPRPPPLTPAPPTLPPQIPVGPCSTPPSKTQTLALSSATPPPTPPPSPPSTCPSLSPKKLPAPSPTLTQIPSPPPSPTTPPPAAVSQTPTIQCEVSTVGIDGRFEFAVPKFVPTIRKIGVPWKDFTVGFEVVDQDGEKIAKISGHIAWWSILASVFGMFTSSCMRESSDPFWTSYEDPFSGTFGNAGEALFTRDPDPNLAEATPPKVVENERSEESERSEEELPPSPAPKPEADVHPSEPEPKAEVQPKPEVKAADDEFPFQDPFFWGF